MVRCGKTAEMDARRNCPVCGADAASADRFLGDTIDESRIVGSSFASRKTPEYMSHAMVRCKTCDLVYVDRPPSQDALATSYHQADYDSADEAEDAASAYIRAIAPVLARLNGRMESALEIGTGTGVFLARLQQAGFNTLVGIEPSTAAIDAAPPEQRAWIREGIFERGQYPAESFDLIVCFMTLEHVRDPGDVVEEALRLLRPGGAFVSVTHDYRGLVNRVLGAKSPIVDLEHMQLFSKMSARALYLRRGYVDVEARSFRNAYRPSYWLRLVPIPDGLKRRLVARLRGSWLDRRRIVANVGNVMTSAYKAS